MRTVSSISILTDEFAIHAAHIKMFAMARGMLVLTVLVALCSAVGPTSLRSIARRRFTPIQPPKPDSQAVPSIYDELEEFGSPLSSEQGSLDDLKVDYSKVGESLMKQNEEYAQRQAALKNNDPVDSSSAGERNSDDFGWFQPIDSDNSNDPIEFGSFYDEINDDIHSGMPVVKRASKSSIGSEYDLLDTFPGPRTTIENGAAIAEDYF